MEKRISPAEQHFFFGYYDLQPFDTKGKYHLAHRVDFIDRLHEKDDEAEIGLIELDTLKYTPLTTTKAWNFQQGAMLQWNPANPDSEIIYNALIDGQYVAVTENINTGKKKYAERSIANVSRDGKYGLSINMSRLYDFRPGYGYATIPDPFYNENHSKDDGIYLVDMESGKSKLIISMQDIWEFSGGFYGGIDKKMVINHITFNPSGNRFLFLPRDFHIPTKQIHHTAIITANLDGSDMFLLSDYGWYNSHYHWKNDDTVIFYAKIDGRERGGEVGNYELHDKSMQCERIGADIFVRDNHMSYSPCGSRLLWDSYPDADMMQTLAVTDLATMSTKSLGKYVSMKPVCTDVRCDLHPRWNTDGSAVSFDSTHEGYRGIYLIENA